MKFVADEGIERQVVKRLRRENHDVLYVAEMEPGRPDDDVLFSAMSDGAVLLTNDKDFGELVYRQGRASSGVVLIRLAGLSADTKAAFVAKAVAEHADELCGFTVISPGMVRVRKPSPSEEETT